MLSVDETDPDHEFYGEHLAWLAKNASKVRHQPSIRDRGEKVKHNASRFARVRRHRRRTVGEVSGRVITDHLIENMRREGRVGRIVRSVVFKRSGSVREMQAEILTVDVEETRKAH